MAMDSASDVLEDALSFPTSDDDWVVTVLVGGLILAGYYVFLVITALIFITFPLVIAPLVLLQGFFVVVIREVLAGEDLPEWSDAGWGRLLGDGIRVSVIGFAYGALLFAPIVVLVLAIGVLGSAAGESGASAVVGAGSLVVSLLYLVGALGLSFVLPAAIVNFARDGSTKAAFDASTIRDVVLARDYVVGWLLFVAVYILSSIVTSVVTITIVGILLVPWISFFFTISFAYIFARAYAGALDLDIPLSDVEPAEA